MTKPILAPGTMPTLAELVELFLVWLERSVARGDHEFRTLEYYERQLTQWLGRIQGTRSADQVRPIDIELFSTGWHSVQSIQRVFNWAVEMGLLQSSPISRVKKPLNGQRRRVLSDLELLRLLRASRPDLRRYLMALRHSMARPQEIRELQWSQFLREPAPCFSLPEFKARKRRKEPHSVRLVLIDRRLLRMLERLRRKSAGEPSGHVFLNSRGRPWTRNAVRLRVKRLRSLLGFAADQRGEEIVPYTFRHTAATLATANGVRDQLLAELLGHTSTVTTRRYQHLQIEHLAGVIDVATRRRRA